jgi:uncharacterized protein YjaZ
MALNIAFQNPSFTQSIKVTEMRAVTDEKTGKVHFKRGNSRIVQRKGTKSEDGLADQVSIWLEPGTQKVEIEALPA